MQGVVHIVASRLLQQVQQERPSPPTLTNREQEVLRLLAQGKLNKEIVAVQRGLIEW
ncbi:MAG: LuxR C-terminal-related transcriptional regulator [Chloroflexota bacterium]